jgi:hypothetical protein
MIPLTETQRAVYHPQDRRFRVWIRPSDVLVLIVLAVVPLVFARLQRAFWGLPWQISQAPHRESGQKSV